MERKPRAALGDNVSGGQTQADREAIMTEQNNTLGTGQAAEQLVDNQLSDDALANVAAGAVVDAGGGEEHSLRTSSNYECGTYNTITKVIDYCPCPRCGKPMHTTWYLVKWYCDPCDYSEFLPTHKTWSGTKEELIAAAN